MVPTGEEVNHRLAEWRGEMNAKVQGIEELRKEVKDLARQVDKIDTKVTTINVKASTYAAFGGFVGTALVAITAAFGAKII